MLLFAWIVAIGHGAPTTLPVTPTISPGTVAPLPDDPLAEARRRYHQADYAGARAILEPFLAERDSWPVRSATRLLLGRIYMELGLYNRASSVFYQVRRGEGGDAKVAAWYEAVADLKRGRPHATIRECLDYIEQYKAGRRVSECMVLIGDAKAEQGRLREAEKAYTAYLDKPEHKPHLREEEMELRLALGTAKHRPERAIPLLQNLALRHRFAATGAGARRALESLREAGHEGAVVPTDIQSQMLLAESLRRSGWVDRAWALFHEIEAQGEGNPKVTAWIAQSRSSFARSTRHPIPGTLQAVAEYRAPGGATGRRAWSIFEGWRKAGRWDKAAKWGQIGLEKHGKQWPWRGQRDEVAHAIMLSGDWEAATTAWDSALKARHGPKRMALFYRSLTAHLAGDHERADAGFTTLINWGGRDEMAARYWRIRAREAAGKTNTMVDRTRIASTAKAGWYQLLLQPPQPQGEGWVVRDGRWGGQPTVSLPEWERPETEPGVQVGWRDPAMALEEPEPAKIAWSRLSWPYTNAAETFTAPPEGTLPTVDLDIPDTFEPSAHYDPDAAMRALVLLGKKGGERWPDLVDAVHLAQAGLYDEVGPIFRAAYAEVRRIRKKGSAAEREALDALGITEKTWTLASLAARDHHHIAKRLSGGKPPEVDAEAWEKLALPVAHARELWPHCQRWDMDPFLVLSIMRQESIYNPDALSHTGAIGLMQFIKGTGAKVSALLDEPLFSPQTLYNPSINLRYSVYYLRLLDDRFNGHFPMAVASYNGGPHHMSRAHRSTLGRLELDAFVEMIPRREPRDYVKKVVSYYKSYVSLYGPEGASVVLPGRLRTDDTEVVNF